MVTINHSDLSVSAARHGWELVTYKALGKIAAQGERAIAAAEANVIGMMGSLVYLLPGTRGTVEAGSIFCGSHDTSVHVKGGGFLLAHPRCCFSAARGATVWAFPGAFRIRTKASPTVYVVDSDACEFLPEAARAFFSAVAREVANLC